MVHCQTCDKILHRPWYDDNEAFTKLDSRSLNGSAQVMPVILLSE